MQFDRSRIREGMTVYSSDGEKLGKVQSCDASMFVIEKGFFFPKDYVARYEDVASVDTDDIRLSLAKDTFLRLRESGHGDEDVRVPIVEEELEVTRRPVLKDEVRLRKDRFTEQRAAEADVQKERVDIEGDEGSRRIDRTEDDFGTTRRMGEPDESGSPRRTTDESFTSPIIPPPPRDDT